MSGTDHDLDAAHIEAVRDLREQLRSASTALARIASQRAPHTVARNAESAVRDLAPQLLRAAHTVQLLADLTTEPPHPTPWKRTP